MVVCFTHFLAKETLLLTRATVSVSFCAAPLLDIICAPSRYRRHVFLRRCGPILRNVFFPVSFLPRAYYSSLCLRNQNARGCAIVDVRAAAFHARESFEQNVRRKRKNARKQTKAQLLRRRRRRIFAECRLLFARARERGLLLLLMTTHYSLSHWFTL